MYEDQHKSSGASVALESRRFTEISREIKRERRQIRKKKTFKFLLLTWAGEVGILWSLPCVRVFSAAEIKTLHMSETFLFILKT